MERELSHSDIIKHIHKYIISKGYIFSPDSIKNFHLSLKTKPFVILAGISGTGKSKIVRLFAEAIGATTNNGRFKMISVKPDWNDSTELFGYKNINDEFIPGQLTEIIKEAAENNSMPYFVCIDEMNLARVEYYLSEYLSLIESRRVQGGKIVTDNIFNSNFINNEYGKSYIPENLYIVGTVNMDDTTFQFSRKVLDRANTIEFSEVDLNQLFLDSQEVDEVTGENVNNSFIKTNYLNINDIEEEYREYAVSINNNIVKINDILKKARKHFAYRVRDEIIFYMVENKKLELLNENTAFDCQIMQKILPAISGSEVIIKDVLVDLFNFCLGKEAVLSDINYL
ncbi:AAA family ATPase [Clostridium sp. CX1]|uniref:McrB family protein n=1 Tax=Clostridium sp. CX1 TaxID=2978346 RepID=UPI0021BE6AE2|nr:AAA family ATPase [Clostridium sp. CX1]MCT8977899.1 AAA family ATPase [Clostridium sp. CX1]